MLRCKKCNKPSARVVTKRELHTTSKGLGPVGMPAAAIMAAAAAKAAPSAPGIMMRAAKAATKDTRSLLIAAGISAATLAVGHGVKYLAGRLASNDKKFVYCSDCGHYEAMP